jgi:xanthine dehydrogenase accessory factor
MDSIDQDVWSRVGEWLGAGHGVMLGTVTRTWGSAPRPVGACVAIRDDGLIVGSVSGGCVEADLAERCAAALRAEPAALPLQPAGALPLPAPPLDCSRAAFVQPFVATYGVSRDEAARWGLPCGGTLEIVLQPLLPGRADWVDTLLQHLQARRCMLREVDIATGQTKLGPAPPDAQTRFDGRTLATVHGPCWRLLLVGAGQLSRYLAEMAQALGYAVAVCDPREEYSGSWRVDGVALSHDYPDDFVLAARPDARTAVVTLTHDPKLDDAALIEALASPAFYVGALGSQRSSAARRERLALFDLSPQQIAALHAPVGLPIGSHTPPEIAVSILAELTAVRNGVRPAAGRGREEPAEPAPALAPLSCA